METTPFLIDLLEAFDRYRGPGVVAFVGSGPSCDAGLPSWPELLRRVAVEVGLESEVEDKLSKGEFQKVAQFLARERSEKDIQERVAKQIERSEGEPSLLHRLIVNLPFTGIITTNYDLLLTKADIARNFKPAITHLNSSLRAKLRERFILHLHGHVGDPETIVITRQGYDYIELKGDKIHPFLAGVFQTRVVLFIGFGFADEHIDDVLRDLKDKGVLGESTVFALIPSPSTTDRVLHESLRVRSINPIYITDTGDYGIRELQIWLERLQRSLTLINSSQTESVAILKPEYLVNRIERLFASDQWLPLLAQALTTLPNRPDLQHFVRLKLRATDVRKILERVGLEEMRVILVSINKVKRDPVIEDALTCFPPLT